MKKLLVASFMVILVLSLVLAGCSSAPATTTATTTTTTAASTTTTSNTTTPATTTTTAVPASSKYGGVFKFSDGMGGYTQFGDPLNIFGPSNYPASLSLERLIEPGDTYGTYKYVLATNIQLSADKTYYDITLRPNVTFHDGTPFNAEAVKWNMQRVIDAKRAELAKVSSIEVVNDLTVRLHLTSWDSRILNDFFRDDLMMISPTAFQANGGSDWANTHPIGTGPFIYVENKDNQYMVWKKNPSYWGKDADGNQLPYLDGVELHNILDPVTFTAAAKNGEVLGTWASTRSVGAEFQKDSDFNVYLDYPWFVQGLSMNSTDPNSVWSDVRMRQALAYALDEKTICDNVGLGFIEPVQTMIRGLEATGYTSANPYTYNPEKAKQLMAEAGHPSVKARLIISSAQWTGGDGDYVQIWQQELKAVGIDIEITPVEFAVINEMTQKPLPVNDLITTFLRGNAINPIEPVMESLNSGTTFNIGMARPAEWPALLQQVLQEPDKAKQLEILKQMDQIAYSQLLPMIPLQSSSTIAVMNKKAHDYTFSLGGAYLSNAWLDK